MGGKRVHLFPCGRGNGTRKNDIDISVVVSGCCGRTTEPLSTTPLKGRYCISSLASVERHQVVSKGVVIGECIMPLALLGTLTTSK